MTPPPELLQEAKILYWTATDAIPFYYVQDGTEAVAVAAMAIGKYEYSEGFQLFTCDEHWQVVNDTDVLSLKDASQMASHLAHSHLLVWHEFRSPQES